MPIDYEAFQMRGRKPKQESVIVRLVLTRELDQWLRHQAMTRGKPMSAIVRDMMDREREAMKTLENEVRA